MRSVRIDPFYFFHGVFEDDAVNEARLLLPYEKARVKTLLLSLNRRWDLFSEGDAQTIVYCVAAGIPFRGLDPYATLGLVLMGVENWTDPVIASDVRVAGPSCLHRGAATCSWYPSSWQIVCGSGEAARTVLDLVGRAFQNACYESDFGTDSDYEDGPVMVRCGYDEEVVMEVSIEGC